MSEKTVRELSGEIWAEVNKAFWERGEEVDVGLLNEFVDISLGGLARHVGSTIENDSDLPVEPLPN